MKFKIDVKCCKCKCSFELAPTSFLKRESADCPNCGQPISNMVQSSNFKP